MIKFPKEIKRILSALQANHFEAYTVGPCVRDSIGGLSPYAWDVATNAGIEDLKRIFPDSEVLSEKYATIRMEYIEEVEVDDLISEEGYIIDVYRYRNADGSLADNIDDDLKRRFFSCDAIGDSGIRMADPVGGLDDLNKKLLKTTVDAGEMFRKDPLKIMDALELVSKLGMDFSKDLYEAVVENYRELANVDMKELGEKFYEMMSGANTGKALSMIVNTGILNIILDDSSVAHLTSREKSDITLLCQNIDKTQKVPERRLGLFYSVLSKGKALPSIEKFQFEDDLNQKLIDAVKDMPTLYFAVTPEALKRFMYSHGMERFEYMLNLEKASRIVFDLDIELKIRSKLYTLDKIRTSGDPVFIEDLCIDYNDIIEAGITKDKEQAEKLAVYVLEHCINRPQDHNREKCLKLAKLYKRDPLSRATRKMQWMR